MVSGSLIKRVVRRQVMAIAVAALLFGTCGHARGGTIAPRFLATLGSAEPDDTFPVIVKLSGGTDFQALDSSLAHEMRSTRTRSVVQALRARAEVSQKGIRGELDRLRQMGRVGGVRYFWVTDGIALTANAVTIRDLAARGDVAEVVPDRIISLGHVAATTSPATDWNLELIGAPILWQMGYTGQGIVVATLDSGVDIDHPALAGKWRGGSNSWFDAVSTPPSTVPFDDNGHGTNVMGVLVAGNTTDNRVGVAPGASWIAAKIFDRNGNGTLSGIHAAFQWLLDPDGDGNPADAPNVVNCSWGIGNAGQYDPEFAPDIAALTTAGIEVVFAGGNSGPNAGSSMSPANNPGTVSVGATDSTDVVTTTSSRGPSAYDGSIFPTVTAPGEGIRTTDLTGGGLFPNAYTTADGTSLAAPQVAGAFALLLSIDPHRSAGELEAAVAHAVLDLGTSGPDNSYGYGRLDVVRAAESLSLIPPHMPSGDVDGDGMVTVNDALQVLRGALGLAPWSARLLYDGDVAPLANGIPAPDGRLTLLDALAILQKAVGVVTW